MKKRKKRGEIDLKLYQRGVLNSLFPLFLGRGRGISAQNSTPPSLMVAFLLFTASTRRRRRRLTNDAGCENKNLFTDFLLFSIVLLAVGT